MLVHYRVNVDSVYGNLPDNDMSLGSYGGQVGRGRYIKLPPGPDAPTPPSAPRPARGGGSIPARWGSTFSRPGEGAYSRPNLNRIHRPSRAAIPGGRTRSISRCSSLILCRSAVFRGRPGSLSGST